MADTDWNEPATLSRYEGPPGRRSGHPEPISSGTIAQMVRAALNEPAVDLWRLTIDAQQVPSLTGDNIAIAATRPGFPGS